MFELRQVRMAICPLSNLPRAAICFDLPPSPLRTGIVVFLLADAAWPEVTPLMDACRRANGLGCETAYLAVWQWGHLDSWLGSWSFTP